MQLLNKKKNETPDESGNPSSPLDAGVASRALYTSASSWELDPFGALRFSVGGGTDTRVDLAPGLTLGTLDLHYNLDIRCVMY